MPSLMSQQNLAVENTNIKHFTRPGSIWYSRFISTYTYILTYSRKHSYIAQNKQTNEHNYIRSAIY